MIFRILFYVFCLSGILPELRALEPYDSDTPRFFISSFRNNDQQNLYIATSFDGRRFDPFGGNYVYRTPDASIIRDPSIIRHDGVWYVCHTAGTSLGNVDYFRVLSSPDLINWQHVCDVSMASIPNTRYTWAPEWFRDDDGSLHVLVSASYWITNEHVIFELHPQDPANIGGAWSTPVRLSGSAFPEFVPRIDGNGQPINGQLVGAYDPYVLKINGNYHIWYFYRPTCSLAHAISANLTGPYTADATTNLYGTGTWKEGQSMSFLGGKAWRFTYANALTSTLWYIESADDWATWSSPQLLGSPEGLVFNHGTVIFNPEAPKFECEVAVTESGEIRLSVPTLKQSYYRLQYSTDLSEWLDAGDPFAGDGAPVDIFPDAPSASRSFYRVEYLPFQ